MTYDWIGLRGWMEIWMDGIGDDSDQLVMTIVIVCSGI